MFESLVYYSLEKNMSKTKELCKKYSESFSISSWFFVYSL